MFEKSGWRKSGHGGKAGEMRELTYGLNDDFVELGDWTPLGGCLSSWGTRLAQPKACRDSRVTGGRGCSWPLTFGVSSGNGVAGLHKGQ